MAQYKFRLETLRKVRQGCCAMSMSGLGGVCFSCADELLTERQAELAAERLQLRRAATVCSQWAIFRREQAARKERYELVLRARARNR